MNNKSIVGIWIALGALVGFAFGTATHQAGSFTGIGISIGAALGLVLTRKNRK